MSSSERTRTPASNPPRSMLFVSGEKVERYAKAMAACADLVCIDLEDAVHPDRKAQARVQVLGWLQSWVRRLFRRSATRGVCAVRTQEGLRDALALVEAGVQLDWLLLPKIEHAADVQMADAWFGAQVGALVGAQVGAQVGGICALLETPLGIENALEIARAGGRMGALMLGGADLSAELGAQFAWDGLLPARGRLVNAARAAGVQAWDVPHVDVGNLEELASETRRVLALGYDCKTAIHPQQINTIHAAFAPTPAELEWAQLLVQAVPEGQFSGAFLYQGRMVDAPLVRKARRIVEIAHRN